VVIDRLSAAYVGAYGNTWIRTPAFDHLAAQSLVLSRATIDSPDLDDTYRSFWTGRPAWQHHLRNAPPGELPLAQWYRDQRITTILLTDTAEVAEHSLATFNEVIYIPGKATLQLADDWQATQAAAFFASAIELLDARSPPAVVWLHCSTLGRIWDSPQSCRDQYVASEDPSANSIVEPPTIRLDDDPDPDLLLGLQHAYAGEVSVIDHALDILIEAVDRSHWRDALLMVASMRGYPLGEHGIVGASTSAFYGELLQVPWFVRSPTTARYGARSQALVQPADVFATLKDWSKGDSTPWPSDPFAGRSMFQLLPPRDRIRDLALVRSNPTQMAISTPAWFLRASVAGDENKKHQFVSDHEQFGNRFRLELFAKPDDYFEVNDVSNRCLEVIDEFQQMLECFQRGIESGGTPELFPSSALTEHNERR
jgi:Sulfatase